MMKSFLKPGEEQRQLPISVEQYNMELDEAMKRIDIGGFTTLEELEKEMQTW